MHRPRFTAFVLALASSNGVAHAQSVDCRHVLNSKQPFEIRYRNRAGKEDFDQVYRSNHLIHTVYRSVEAPAHNKYVLQGTFAKFRRARDGTEIELVYSIPTDEFIFDQHIADFTFHDRNPPSTPMQVHVTYFEDEDYLLGACNVHVKHFLLTYQRSVGLLSTELWYSPQLNAHVKMSNIINRPEKMITTGNSAEDIRTSFFPIK